MNPVLEVRGATKAFPGVLALDDVHFDLVPGEIHALAGENGSGKSTLVKILGGLLQPDRGTTVVDGAPRVFGWVRDAMEQGIALVTQELTLVPHLSVAENIFLGRHPRRRGLVDWRSTRRQAVRLLERLAVDVDPAAPVTLLPTDRQQLVEIARALSYDARVLLLDEPTSSLDPDETRTLFAVLRRLAAEGVAIAFISHRIEELLDLGHRLTVLRDGRAVARADDSEVDEDWLVRNMVGRSLEQFFPGHTERRKGCVLSVRSLRDPGRVRDVSFDVNGGEIVGLAGLVGAGRTELLETIIGIRPRVRGSLTVDGVPVRSGVDGATEAGMILVPDDRRAKGIVPALSVRENVLLTVARGGMTPRRRRRERAIADEWCARLGVRTAAPDAPVSTLSGGNQQKVILARGLATTPKVVLLDEPTRGIDVGAKTEIYRIIVDLANRGTAVVMASSELPELLGVCDRVLVMNGGALVADLDRECMSEEAVVAAATGVRERVAS